MTVAARGMGEAGTVEWDGGMFRRAEGRGRMAEPVREASGGRPSRVELAGQRLVEHEFWYGLGFSGIEGRGLVKEEVSVTTLRAVPGPRAGEIGGGP